MKRTGTPSLRLSQIQISRPLDTCSRQSITSEFYYMILLHSLLHESMQQIIVRILWHNSSGAGTVPAIVRDRGVAAACEHKQDIIINAKFIGLI